MAWTEEHRPAADGAVEEEGKVATLDPVTGEILESLSLGNMLSVGTAGLDGKLVLALGDPDEPKHHLTVLDGSDLVGRAALCESCRVLAMESDRRRSVLAVVAEQQDRLEAVDIDPVTTTPKERAVLSGLTCPRWSCHVKLSSDGESYYVSQADADGVVRIVSIRRAEDGSLSVSAPWIVAAAEEGWRAFDVASTGPGRFLFAYERIDEALDASRIFTRVVTLAPF